MGGLGGRLSSTAIFSVQQSRTIQILATVCAAVSVLSTLITLYQLLMLKRNFRRSLILLLIVGDFFKSIWYLVFASTALSVGGIKTSSDFCQANGFLLQTSIEACDMAILFMSMHMFLQIFNSSSKVFGHDGLYRFRHTVMGLYFALPLLSASLAFINNQHGYISQGPFCTLPIRPYWYRLALTWIPRYLIWIYIMYVALRIYLHVGKGFKVFARQHDRTSSVELAQYSEDRSTIHDLHPTKQKSAPGSLGSDDQQDESTAHPSPDGDVPSLGEPERRISAINWTPSFTTPANSDSPESAAGSRRGSRVAFQLDNSNHSELLQIPPPDQKRSRGSITTLCSFRSNGDFSVEGNRPPTLEPIEESRTLENREDDIDLTSEDTPLKKRRRAIQRQLRLLFIYPMVYMIMWAIPFVYHSMNYSDYYAQHPVYGLAVVAVFCQSFLASVDCLVFGWREKPWKHIQGSDGTFLGSFMFWRFQTSRPGLLYQAPAPGRIPRAHDQEAGPQEGPRAAKARGSATSHTSIKPMMMSMMHKKTWSGASDRTTMAAEQAAERLALERADREGRSVTHSRNASLSVNNRPTSEWWDRRLSQAVLDTPADESESYDLH